VNPTGAVEEDFNSLRSNPHQTFPEAGKCKKRSCKTPRLLFGFPKGKLKKISTLSKSWPGATPPVDQPRLPSL
jgi:hypothetical protein